MADPFPVEADLFSRELHHCVIDICDALLSQSTTAPALAAEDGKADTARLDWWNSKREPITEQHPDSDEPRLIAYGWQGFAGEFTDLRAAIDAAMEEGQ